MVAFKGEDAQNAQVMSSLYLDMHRFEAKDNIKRGSLLFLEAIFIRNFPDLLCLQFMSLNAILRSYCESQKFLLLITSSSYSFMNPESMNHKFVSRK